MDQESSEKNSPLPEFDSKFWPKDSDNRTFTTKEVSCQAKGHKFTMTKRAGDIKCDCGVGYRLSEGMTLKEDGHVYLHQKLVI